jgi:hypothetical protein
MAQLKHSIISITRSDSKPKYLVQGVTKRCRLSWLTNSAPAYTSPNAGGWRVAGSQPMSKAVRIMWHGAQINFGDLTPYLTYDLVEYE